jgi:hypothetical protein
MHLPFESMSFLICYHSSSPLSPFVHPQRASILPQFSSPPSAMLLPNDLQTMRIADEETIPGLQTGKRKQVWKRRDLKNEDVIMHYGEARETDIVIPCV